jgi:hypothetical protein
MGDLFCCGRHLSMAKIDGMKQPFHSSKSSYFKK